MPTSTKLPPPRHVLSKGYVPDLLIHHTQRDGSLLLRANRLKSVRTPRSYSIESFEGEICDQGQTGSCTGHGSAQGLYTSFAASGDPLGFFPSPLAIYQLGRIEGAGNPAIPLADNGAQPFFVMQGLNSYGVRPMGPSVDGRVSDVSTANVNTRPLLSQLEDEGLTLVTGEYRIDPQDEGPSGAIAQICSCIAQGTAVGLGFQVDSDFEDWLPTMGPMNTYNATNYQGGHWVCITSYDNFDPSAPEKTVLRGANSWSRSWGSNGHFEGTGLWFQKTAIDVYPFLARRAPVSP
jgi:hypothetical protein